MNINALELNFHFSEANQLRNKSSKDFYNFDIDSSIFNAKNPS